jgi:methylmalonyl-CoA mutase
MWRALVEKTLNGAPFEERLVSKTYDGIDIQPLYTAANSKPPLAEGLRQRRPFDADRPWDIRAVVDHPDPVEAGKLALAELEGGATSLLVKIDPTGANGVAVGSRADLARALDGVLFDLAPVALDAEFIGPDVATWLHDVAQSKTLKPHLRMHLDPIGAFARAGRSPGPIEAHLSAAAEIGARLDAESVFLASGQAVHEAGGGEAQEIAFMAASALAYAKALIGEGVETSKALDCIALGLAADADYFLTIAKIRAARAVWGRIAGTVADEPTAAHIEVRSSRRMLSTLDPWVNMLRLTSAAFGASIGGADAVVLDSFTQPLGRSTPFARRQARNIQLVLMEEAHLGRVADPAGGAWYVETLTEQLARAAWTAFQEIEKRGGIVSALSSGFVAETVDAARAARTADLKDKKTKILGVTVFRSPDDADVAIDPIDPRRFAKASPDVTKPGRDGACTPLTPWRAAEAFETSETA